jgi:hypothetical protein
MEATMKYFLAAVVIGLLLAGVPAGADCIKNLYGKVVCGEGQCEMDTYGKVFCTKAGGGAIKDKYGKVQCGVGRCAQDYLQVVWCSKEPGGSAAVDSYGKVKCFGGCEVATPKLCQEAQ